MTARALPDLALALALAALAARAAGQGPAVVVAPDPPPAKWTELAAARGRAVVLTSDTPADWRLCSDAARLVVFPDKKGAAFTADADGEYRVFVAGPGGLTGVLVKVGSPQPPPPAPTPPGPSPVPPGPVPPGPVPPADPFAARLKAAYDADPLQLDKRRGMALNLVALYQLAATLAQDKAVLTVADHSARVKAAAERLAADDGLRPDALAGVRAAVAAELAAAFPAGPPAQLDDAARARAAAVYQRAAAALAGVAQ